MRTAYDGPTITTSLRFGNRAIQLVRPGDPDRLLDADDVRALNHRDDYMPYWAYLWPGAFLLADAVARHAWPPGLEALEIGCGLGLAGLTALAGGVDRVVFTDYDEAPLEFVQRSVEANALDPGRVRAARLDWRELPVERYGLILGADVLYERRLVPLVANLLAHMLEPDGEAWIAGPYRVATEDLPLELERHGLAASAEPVEAVDDHGRPVRGTLHRIRRAGG